SRRSQNTGSLGLEVAPLPSNLLPTTVDLASTLMIHMALLQGIAKGKEEWNLLQRKTKRLDSRKRNVASVMHKRRLLLRLSSGHSSLSKKQEVLLNLKSAKRKNVEDVERKRRRGLKKKKDLPDNLKLKLRLKKKIDAGKTGMKPEESLKVKSDPLRRKSGSAPHLGSLGKKPPRSVMLDEQSVEPAS